MSNSLQDRLILLLIASLENLQLFLCKEGKEFDLPQKDFSNNYVRNTFEIPLLILLELLVLHLDYLKLEESVRCSIYTTSINKVFMRFVRGY